VEKFNSFQLALDYAPKAYSSVVQNSGNGKWNNFQCVDTLKRSDKQLHQELIWNKTKKSAIRKEKVIDSNLIHLSCFSRSGYLLE